MSRPTDRDEVVVILDLYKRGKISINQALNLLGFKGSRVQDTSYPGVVWPDLSTKPLRKHEPDDGC